MEYEPEVSLGARGVNVYSYVSIILFLFIKPWKFTVKFDRFLSWLSQQPSPMQPHGHSQWEQIKKAKAGEFVG